AVEIAAEIEEECFESRRAACTDGRVDSEARHSLESASCCTVAFYRKDAVQGGPRACEADVCRGEAQQPPALGTMQHPPADGVGPAQQLRRRLEIPHREGFANGGAGDARRAVEHRRQDLDLEADAPP